MWKGRLSLAPRRVFGSPGRTMHISRSKRGQASRVRVLKAPNGSGNGRVIKRGLRAMPAGSAAVRRRHRRRRGRPSRAQPPLRQLTSHELRVLGLAAQGLSFPRIAKRMSVSVNTVMSHAKRIYRQLGAHNRANVIIIGLRRGLIKPRSIGLSRVVPSARGKPSVGDVQYCPRCGFCLRRD